MKSFLGNFSLIFFALLAFIGVLMVLAFFDLSGIHPDPLLINGDPRKSVGLNTVATLMNSPPKIEWKNPLAEESSPDLFTTPTGFNRSPLVSPSDREKGQSEGDLQEIVPTIEPTPTPLPMMEPVEYRMEITLRAKNFAAALESFLAANDRLAKVETLLKDPVWNSEMSIILVQVAETGWALSSTGPPPPEYATIHAWLVQVGPAAEDLRENYQYSLDSGDSSGFTAAGENFSNIKENLSAALSEMSRVGWPLE